MKATEANLLKFLRKSQQFIIPIYQRNYAWTEEQCKQLWSDLMRAGKDSKVTAHFIGSIVYIERGLSNVTQQEALMVIDGQQRLTTCALLIAALANHFERENIAELLEAFSAKKLRHYYLLNPDEEGERHFKLLLSQTDKDSLLSILKNQAFPEIFSHRVKTNYDLFGALISANANQLEIMCKGLAKLMIVDVSLDRTQDNPQLIFESMNSTGLELSQADLIRNYILMGLEPTEQAELYQKYWRPIETAFGQAAYSEHFDKFMRHYLTAKTGVIPNISQVYRDFKTFTRSQKGTAADWVADIHAYASYYCAVALGTEKDGALAHAFHDLRLLRVEVSYPFLLQAYHDYKLGHIDSTDLVAITRMLESYVFRRVVCGVPTNSMNKTFAALIQSLDKENYLESVWAAFLLLPSYRRFPSDEEFKREIQICDLYNIRISAYWLRRLENFGRKERVAVEDYTIEHILPQNANLSLDWQNELGEDWQTIQAKWLHTLGNLTLTAYNSQYSDATFKYKRDEVKDKDNNLIGFSSSPLKLNLGLGQVPCWNEEAIKTRAERLATEALKVWVSPKLSANTLASYLPKKDKQKQFYSREDHPNIASGASMQVLFDALSKEIIAIDACVTEEFLKLYVAFKAETNFVDIVPLAEKLKLTLNIPFYELDDPKKIARDVTDIGKWGNGNTQLIIDSEAQLPYIVQLIRQSYDWQVIQHLPA